MSSGVAAPVTAGLAIGIVFVVAFSFFANVGACGAPGLQISPPDLERQVKYSSLIVYGTVMSAELQPVDYIDWEWGDSIEMRYVVTIRADKYLLDRTDGYAPIITFREPGFGCAYPFRSEVHADNPYAVEHKEGEKALFFIEKLEGPYLGEIEGDWASFSLFDKFAIVGVDDEGKELYQSKWYKNTGKEPVPAQELEAKIRGLIADGRENSNTSIP